MEFKKSDLVAGKHVVKYRDGKFRFVGEYGALLNDIGNRMHTLNYHDERLNSNNGNKMFDIVAVYELNEVWKREEPTITEDEKAILRNLPGKYEWIARDGNDVLYVYQYKPKKCEEVWVNNANDIISNLRVFNHLFKMVQWTDGEPWKIEDLLKLDVKEDK